MESTSAMTTPPEQVDQLIQMVADEAGLNVAGQLDGAGTVGTKVPEQATTVQETVKEDDLEARLAALRK